MKRISVLITLVLAAPLASAAQNEPLLKERDQQKLGKLFADYFESRTANDTKKMLKAYEALKKDMTSKARSNKVDSMLISAPDMRAVFGVPMAPEKSVKKGIVKKYSDSKTLMSGDFDFEYFLRVPRSYKSSNRYPLVLFLHPTTLDEDDLKDWVEKIYPDALLDEALIVAPINGSGSWTTDTGLMMSFFSLSLIVNGYSIDRMRIFIDGQGNGANAAVDYITRYPGFFAAGVLRGMDATSETPMLGNAHETPLLLLSPSDGDTAKVMSDFTDQAKSMEVELVELVQTDFGDEGHPGEAGTEALTRFLADTRKRIAPDRVKFTTTSRVTNSSYWLQLTDFEATDSDPVTVEAEIDHAKNEIHVTTPPSVLAFTIYLNDDLVDMGKSLKILHTIAGEGEGDNVVKPEVRFEGTKPRNLEKALAVWYDNRSGNAGEVYTNYVDISIAE